VFETTGIPALGDDSGLEVDALGGSPGLRSARFAGENATDEKNNALLLERLAKVSPADRTARFRCAIAFVRAADVGSRAARGFLVRAMMPRVVLELRR